MRVNDKSQKADHMLSTPYDSTKKTERIHTSFYSFLLFKIDQNDVNI